MPTSIARTASHGGPQAIRQVIARRRQEAEQKALAAGRLVAELSRAYGIGSEFRVVWHDSVDGNATLRTLHCDLIIAAHPKPHDLPKGWSGERLLLASGIPVLLVPHAWNGPTIGASVMIAWNGSRRHFTHRKHRAQEDSDGPHDVDRVRHSCETSQSVRVRPG